MINKEGKGGSVVLELAVSVALVLGIGYGIYAVQHPHLTQAQQITESMSQ